MGYLFFLWYKRKQQTVFLNFVLVAIWIWQQLDLTVPVSVHSNVPVYTRKTGALRRARRHSTTEALCCMCQYVEEKGWLRNIRS
jgi:hypothetical protein